MTKQNPSDTRALTLFQNATYGFLTLPIAMGGMMLVLFLPTYYAVNLGLGLTVVGLVIGIGRVIDVITDPLIGRLSDNTRSRWGARRPWMIFALPLYLLAAWFFFVPGEGVGIAYLILASTAYFLFFTMFDVPYSSVGLEISPHLHERTDLASMRALFQVIGALLAATLPLVLKLTGIDALQAITTVMIGLAIFGLIAFWFLVPVRKTTETASRKSIITALRTAFSQPAYRQMITAFMLVQVANAFPAALMVLFIINVIGMPELINIALPLLILSSALFLPLWMFLSRLIGKRRTWMVSIMFCCAMLCFVPFLGAGDQWPLIAICIGLGAVFGCDTIMPTSILADIVYRTDQKSDGNFGGTFLAAKNSVSKLAFVAPLLIAFPLLEFLGFDRSGANGQDELLALALFFGPLPILLRLGALWVLRSEKSS